MSQSLIRRLKIRDKIFLGFDPTLMTNFKYRESLTAYRPVSYFINKQALRRRAEDLNEKNIKEREGGGQTGNRKVEEIYCFVLSYQLLTDQKHNLLINVRLLYSSRMSLYRSPLDQDNFLLVSHEFLLTRMSIRLYNVLK